MQAKKQITVIPATKNTQINKENNTQVLRKVAGYARVSTDQKEQITSYQAQVDYYTNYIKSRSDWQFVGVYTDEGISALNTKKRDGFNKMIADALAGKIDLIVTKSVSRFARNTVDSLTTVRKLKEKGIEVYFEKENIWTLDSKGELLITIMSSLAQEESRSISENVTWGQRKRFADGKVTIPYAQFLGYCKGKDGLPQIVESEAKIIRMIYKMFLDGMSTNAIAKELTRRGIKTPRGKDKWMYKTVENILTNEKYKGAALLQKTFTVDFLQKKTKKNEGEVAQYYVEHSHQPIIEPSEWDWVQDEFMRRKSSSRNTYCGRVFSGKLICGDCNEYYGSKVWHSNSKYRRTIWQCNAKFTNDDKCETPHLYEDDIETAFIKALSILYKDRSFLIQDSVAILNELSDFTEINREIADAENEMHIVAQMVRMSIEENATTTVNEADYNDRYNSLVDRYEKLKRKHSELTNALAQRKITVNEIRTCIECLKTYDTLPLKFNAEHWHNTVDSVTVYRNERLVFHFKCKVDIEVSI